MTIRHILALLDSHANGDEERLLSIALSIAATEYDLGARRYNATGETLPASVLAELRSHDAILLGAVSGARTTTASLGMVCDLAESQVPALGYTVTYAIGNTLLTIWGMVLIMLLS